MKDIKDFINESMVKKFDFNNKRHISALSNVIKHLDPYESIAGMNCWDIAWAFGEYIKDELGYKDDVECAVYGNGFHYVPVIKCNDEKYTIDFTVPNQHHYNNPCFPFKNYTTDGLKFDKFILTSDIPNLVKEIEIESPEDLYDEFDDIFETALIKS